MTIHALLLTDRAPIAATLITIRHAIAPGRVAESDHADLNAVDFYCCGAGASSVAVLCSPIKTQLSHNCITTALTCHQVRLHNCYSYSSIVQCNSVVYHDSRATIQVSRLTCINKPLHALSTQQQLQCVRV
jgi:hypothetical protein